MKRKTAIILAMIVLIITGIIQFLPGNWTCAMSGVMGLLMSAILLKIGYGDPRNMIRVTIVGGVSAMLVIYGVSIM